MVKRMSMVLSPPVRNAHWEIARRPHNVIAQRIPGEVFSARGGESLLEREKRLSAIKYSLRLDPSNPMTADEFDEKLENILETCERMTAFVDQVSTGKPDHLRVAVGDIYVEIKFYKKGSEKESAHLVFVTHSFGAYIMVAKFGK